MTDWRMQGQGMRRRMGAPSSHLDGANTLEQNLDHALRVAGPYLPHNDVRRFGSGGNPVGNNPYALPGTEHLYSENQPKPKPWAVPN